MGRTFEMVWCFDEDKVSLKAEDIPDSVVTDWLTKMREHKPDFASDVSDEEVKDLYLDHKREEAMLLMEPYMEDFSINKFLTTSELYAHPLFDPNAYLAATGTGREITSKSGHISALQWILHSATINFEQMMDYIEKGKGLPNALIFENGDQVKNPNGWEEFTSPLVGSAINRGWSMKEILAHPETNPNPDPQKVRFTGATKSKDSKDRIYYELHDIRLPFPAGKSIGGEVPERSSTMTPLDMICYYWSEDIHYERTGKSEADFDIQPDKRYELSEHYFECINNLLDAGAVITPYALAILERDTDIIDKLEAMEQRTNEILSSASPEFTLLDLKHMHAQSRLHELFALAQSDAHTEERLGALYADMPQWMKDHYEMAFSMLNKGWGADILLNREAGADQQKGGR